MRIFIALTLVVLATAQNPPGPCGPFRAGEADTLLAEDFARMNPNTGVECSVKEVPTSPNPLNAQTDPALMWTDGIIYYTLTNEYDADQVNLIKSGIDDLVESTKVNGELCIDIRPRVDEPNFVAVGMRDGCWSYIGMLGGVQRLSLDPGCVAKHGTIMHEFIHAFGFYHEQSRTDRDDWIYVNFDNIEPGYWNNFAKYDSTEINLLGTPYTYGSVMHYSPYGFAMNSSIPTIYTCDPAAMDVIGQRVALDPMDIERIQIYYGCIAPVDSKYFKHLA